ncbi:MAG: (2Fe-2S)-binding protein [Tissierellia bacterium]|nr:(2Fe-2S)-binding protein [Tissierellia bacterium]
MEISFLLNGKQIEYEVDSAKRAIDFIREDLGLTGTKEGCGEGECGACTIILNGKAVTSCTMLAGQLNGTTVTTIEGLAESGDLDRIQLAFIEAGAVQCGFCTPGMILSTKALIDENPHPTVEEIKSAIEGNLCRCTGYAKIVEAIQNVTSE